MRIQKFPAQQALASLRSFTHFFAVLLWLAAGLALMPNCTSRVSAVAGEGRSAQ